MKNFNFLSIGLIALLMVVAVGCTTMRDASEYDEYREDRSTRRVYVDPYYGSDQIILQRDPFTGRYYQVSPYGYYPGRSSYYGRNYSNRNYNYRDNGNQQTQERRAEGQKKISKARDIIRGKNN
ncbi:MAG TPA: hypothetical protein VNA26_04465 [Chitinophagaceae bacterium]|nr:hypothetical protein [Chitinophagaceae bacterium]